jgi:hypothetical protein
MALKKVNVIKYIELVFENCECAKIPFSYVYKLNTGEIKKSLDFCTGSWQNSDELKFMYNTDYIHIVFKDYKNLYYTDTSFTNEETLLKNRLECNDITSVVIHYSEKAEVLYKGNVIRQPSLDEQELQVYVPWDDVSDYPPTTNKLQKVDFKEKGYKEKHYVWDIDAMILTISK